ncbi:dolichol kinase, partial [Coemansia sp. 'formosensis']
MAAAADNCGSSSRLRLFCEACIPALLLAVLAHYYVDSPVLCTVACIISLASVHPASWSSEEDSAQPECRPGADDGAVWGSLLVPISVLATGAGSTPRASRLNEAMVLSLGIPAFGDTCSVARSVLVLLAVSLLQHTWRIAILKGLPRSFTVGEAAVFAQGLILVIADFTTRMTHRLRDDDAPDSAYWESHMHVLCLEAVVIGLWLAVSMLPRLMASGVLGKRARRSVPGLAMLGLVFGGVGVLALALVWYISQINPVLWMLDTVVVAPAHMAILAYWLVLLAMAGVVYALAQGGGSESTKLMLHVKRKSYHVLAAVMFVPGLLYARPLLYMGFAAAMTAFVVAECMRALGVGPCSASIDGFMRGFVDYRDAGPVVTAHFYLLLGCALPVWLGSEPVASLAGVLSLGVADTAASLVGMRLGRVKWLGTAKTVEGTVAFCLSLLAAMAAVRWLAGDVGVAWGWYALVSVVVGVLEALTEQNDNLV